MADRKVLLERAIEEIDRSASDRQREAGELYLRALTGDYRAKHALSEGIATSDVPELLAPAINVQFLAQYAEMPVVWDQIVGDTINAPTLGGVEFGDFAFDASDLEGVHDGDVFVGAGLPGVAEYGEYPTVSYTTEQLAAELRKQGVRLRISWEALIKLGNFDIIGRATAQFARYAAEQEDIALAKQFVNADGVVNSVLTKVAGDPALTLAGLEAAIDAAEGTEVDGKPLNARSYKLVVPTTLGRTAATVLGTGEYERTVGDDTFRVRPDFGNISAVTFWALQSVGNFRNAGKVNSHWFLVPQGTARPAFAEMFLEGYRTPLITIKDSGHFTLGGGAVPAREGSFEIDDVETRARHVVGATVIEPAGVVYSEGDGA